MSSYLNSLGIGLIFLLLLMKITKFLINVLILLQPFCVKVRVRRTFIHSNFQNKGSHLQKLTNHSHMFFILYFDSIKKLPFEYSLCLTFTILLYFYKMRKFSIYT